MKREELIAYDKWLTAKKWLTGIIVSPEKAADLYLAEHPLPPAEGAEKSCLNCRFHNSPTYHDKMWCRDCQQLNHYKPKQPTAEGAEEIKTLVTQWEQFKNERWWNSEAIDVLAVLINEFSLSAGYSLRHDATLHAQKIADKMVSERLREELIRFAMWTFSGGETAAITLVNNYTDNLTK